MELHAIDQVAMFVGQRLMKREEEPPAKLWLQIDSMDTRFMLQLEKRSLLLGPINVHAQEESVEENASVAYQGTRLIVMKPPQPIDISQLDKIKAGKGVEVDEEPLARFLLHNHRLQGGFEWAGRFLQVKETDDPIFDGALIQIDQSAQAMASARNSTAPVILLDKPSSSSIGKYRCGHDQLPFNLMPHHRVAPEPLPRLQARADGDGCPVTLQVLPVAVVADCSYLRRFDGNKARAQANIINDFNLVNGIYERTFNLSLGLVSIDLYVECSPPEQTELAWNRACTIDPPTLQTRLSQFSWWRGKKQTANQAALFVLLTGCQEESDVVGIAWLNQVCRKDAMRSGGQWVSGAAVTSLVPNQFTVLAHEIGHTLGAVHDCDREACSTCDYNNSKGCQCCTCGDGCDCRGKFVMHPESGGLSMKSFSPCSRGDICRKLPILAQSCLLPPGATRLITGPQCGNGIRETGEECDCGTAEQCSKDPCCREGCKLRAGAACADSNDSCCRECKIIPKEAGVECRSSEGICSPAARCNGQSPECPPAKFLADGAPCEYADGACAAGICTSRDRQCAAVGQRLGITRSCPLDRHSCSIVCQSALGQCVYMDASFIDGTACGRSGHCRAGQCSEPFLISWIQDNSALFYGIMAFMAVALLLLVGKIIWRRCTQPAENASNQNDPCPSTPNLHPDQHLRSAQYK